MPIFMIIALDIVITLRFSINCSAVICSPTVIHAILREATSETYGPWVSFLLYCISFIYIASRLLFLQSLLSNLYNKNTKNIYLTIFIRSHFCDWPWRDWPPLCRVGCEFLFVCVGAWDFWGASYWIDTLVLKNWGKYLCYFAASPFPLQGKTNTCSRGSKKDFWRRCRGGLRQVKSKT